jgi:hypothetical protein
MAYLLQCGVPFGEAVDGLLYLGLIHMLWFSTVDADQEFQQHLAPRQLHACQQLIINVNSLCSYIHRSIHENYYTTSEVQVTSSDCCSLLPHT